VDPYTSWATLERPSFVGRSSLLARLGECTSRLVTVYGPPGAGKTRLVVHHLSDPARGFAPHAPFVVCEVANATSVDEVSAIVRADLGARAEAAPAGGALGDLGEDLAAEGPLVLVLDGLDRASDVAAPAVAAWLARAPELRVVVTSRRRMGLPSEACFEVSALPEAEAVQLFEARTRLLKADFSIHDANAADVKELVRELDCLPLAIELAAGRAAVLSPRELRARLGQRFQLLRGRGGATASHLESAIAVSFELLPDALERALAQASAFRGSFGLEAAEAVLTLPDGALAVDALDELCARSLVRSFEPPTLPGETRFALYESIRAFAEAAFPDEARAAAERHAAFFANLADVLSAKLKETRGGEVMDELAIEEPNLVAAFERSLASAPERAIRAVLALRPLVDAAGPVTTWACTLTPPSQPITETATAATRNTRPDTISVPRMRRSPPGSAGRAAARHRRHAGHLCQ
jgi:predicted ATPase